ncbi:MAG: RHS repeat-associated core domain-containing protein [Acidobacteriota bacterium]|jgi:RHS repeat-associated protein|nr:RHS repeat-associated core domain-containing protein [Rickettsiales bacterium]
MDTTPFTGVMIIGPRFTGKERDGETGLDYFGARYLSGAQGRFTSPDKPFADQDPYDPQSWNLYSYVRNSPLKFVDETGREIVYADRRLQIISDARRQQSTSYNSNLQGFEGPGSRTLTIRYGPTPNDPDGSPTNGLFSGKISPAILDCSPDCVVKTPATLTEATITVNDKLAGDPNQTSDTLAHEVFHADDARTNPQRYSTEKNTDANGKIIPHDIRPVEQRAINGANQSNQERKDFKKRNPEQNKQIDRQRDQQLKQENERRKREGQN